MYNIQPSAWKINSQHKVDIDVIINYFKKHLIFLFELLKI